MTNWERMIAGQLYLPSDAELSAAYHKAQHLIYQINLSEDPNQRKALFRELFGSTGEIFRIEPPFRCDYGCNITIGEKFYANYDCLILDVAPVSIGSYVLFAPRVSIYTAAHPIAASVRDTDLEFGKPVSIGNHVWIGGSVVINPGVTIGDNSVIGSGSVVTKDIPPNVIAVGNPCRVLRPITDDDQRLWDEKMRQFYADMSPS